MADTMTPEQRHRCMSHIRGKNTKPEILVRKYLFAQGLRFRIHKKNLPGHPDITLPKYKIVIFINGCFWHGHPRCKLATVPKSNTEFWLAKIHRNQERDLQEKTQLEEMGWKVIVIWECELKKKVFDETMQRLMAEIKNPAAQIYELPDQVISIAAEEESSYSDNQDSISSL